MFPTAACRLVIVSWLFSNGHFIRQYWSPERAANGTSGVDCFRQTLSNFPGDVEKSECVQHWCASRNRWRWSSALWRHRWRLNHQFQDPHPFPAAIMFCPASLFPSALLLLLVTLFQPSGRLYLPPISLISGLCCEHFTLPIFFSLFSSQNPPSLQCGLCVFSFLCVFLLCTQRCLFPSCSRSQNHHPCLCDKLLKLIINK